MYLHCPPGASLRLARTLRTTSPACGCSSYPSPDDPLGIWVVHVHQVLHDMREINGCPLVGYDHLAPATQRLVQHEHGADPVAHVLVVKPRYSPRSHRHWDALLADQLHAGLVQTHLGPSRIVRPGVDV